MRWGDIMIGSIQKSMAILMVLSNGQGLPVTLAQIAQETGYTKPTCSHILQTLCAEGYAERISHSAGYILGPSTFVLTRYGRYGQKWVSICKPVLEEMEKQAGVAITISIIYGGKRFIVDVADSAHRVFKNNEDIKMGKVYTTVPGRAILAQMDRDELEQIYQKNGAPSPHEWEGVSNFEQMLKELALYRDENGVMIRRNEKISLAKPIFMDMNCVGAVGFSYPFQSEEHSAKMRNILMRGVKEIQRRLNYK